MFKNLHLFLVADLAIDSHRLREAIEHKPLRDLGALESDALGFCSPYGPDDERLVQSVNGCHRFRLGRNRKVLAGSVLNQEVAKRVAKIQASEARVVGRKERAMLKDEVITDLLPRALTQTTFSNAYIDSKNGWLLVDASSRANAEVVTEELRKALGGSLPLERAPDGAACRAVMTGWLRDNELPDGFKFGDQCDLKDDYASARCRRQDLFAVELQAHLRAGKEVTALGLIFSDRISFVLNDHGALKSIRLLDVDESDSKDSHDDPIDNAFALIQLEIERLIQTLSKFFPLKPQS